MDINLNNFQVKEARIKIEDYKRKKLIELQKSIREAFGKFDKGKIDAFELDHIIYQYLRKSKVILSFDHSNSLHGSNNDLSKLLTIIDEDENSN